MSLLKDGALAQDPWVAVADDAPLPEDGAPIVSLARWQRDRAALRARNGALGVRLPNAAPVAAIADDLDRLTLVALEFPKFNDGRAFSQARQLRERYRYTGELRATGQVLRDQLLFMTRCGFDAFEVAKGDPVSAWANALTDFTVFYQPTGDGRPTAAALRRAGG
ncbi:MAG: DUF934 domain-containing protein [Proteobacteria bacterium]|nr:DUF934 domain-containing protein [Pseudomonadota bacterium]